MINIHHNTDQKTIDMPAVETAVKDLLLAIGENPEREGLQDTPARVARFWREFINYEAGNVGSAFSTTEADQMVIVSGMRVYSLCEHHLLPFYCDVSIGYIPNGRVLGLSKFARVAHKFAHRLQIQEQLAQQIADEIATLSGSDSVAVVVSGVHMCMIMRGIKTDGRMLTSVVRGAFSKNPDTRKEFLNLIEIAA